MALDIIGAGFGRTGTLSLKYALELLGFDRCYHMMEVADGVNQRDDRATWAAAHRGQPVDWDELFRGYRATTDWPACNLWRELAAHFPEAKVILTERDPDAWYRSVMSTIYPSSSASRDSAEHADRWEWAELVVWGRVFDDRMDDEDHVIGRYLAHNQAVRDEVSPDRLLVYRPGDGWEPLCDFLGVGVPDEPYPRTNSTAEFQERAARRREDEALDREPPLPPSQASST